MGEWLPTVSEAIDAYLDDARLAGRSPASVRTARAFLKPVRADSLPVSTLTPDACRTAILARLSVNANTARTVHGHLSALCRYCVGRGWLPASPMAGVPRPRKPSRPHRWLTPPQLRAVWDACADDYGRLIVALLLLGLRANELVSLRWQDVDWERGRLTVAFTKNGRPRTAVLDDLALALLRRAREPLPGTAPTAELGRRASPRIVPMSTNALRERVAMLGRRAGIPHLHPHLFRHSFATNYLIEAGIEDIATLQVLGGWSDARQIRDTYARSALEELALKRARDVGLSRRLLGE